jgi:hypothetical protein
VANRTAPAMARSSARRGVGSCRTRLLGRLALVPTTTVRREGPPERGMQRAASHVLERLLRWRTLPARSAIEAHRHRRQEDPVLRPARDIPEGTDVADSATGREPLEAQREPTPPSRSIGPATLPATSRRPPRMSDSAYPLSRSRQSQRGSGPASPILQVLRPRHFATSPVR